MEHNREFSRTLPNGPETQRDGAPVEVQQSADAERDLLPRHRGPYRRVRHRQAAPAGQRQGEPEELRPDQPRQPAAYKARVQDAQGEEEEEAARRRHHEMRESFEEELCYFVVVLRSTTYSTIGGMDTRYK